MRIAQIAPLAERCPPLFYGGTERIVSFLTEELVAQGHEVTLFASGDSVTSAKLVPCAPKALRLDPGVRDPLAYHFSMLEEVRRRAHDFDVLHFHIDYLHFPMSRDFVNRTVTTLHGRLDMPDVHPLFAAYSHVPLASISQFQRKPMPPGLNWAGNIYHGLPQHLLPFSTAGKGGYLAFLGRISPGKAAGPRHRDRRARRPAARHRRQDRQGGPRLLAREDRAHGPRQSERRIYRRDRRTAEGTNSSAMPAPCCSPSTGRSRSAWS